MLRRVLQSAFGQLRTTTPLARTIRRSTVATVEPLERRALLALSVSCGYGNLLIQGDDDGPENIKVEEGTESGLFIIWDLRDPNNPVRIDVFCPCDRIIIDTGVDTFNDRVEDTTDMDVSVDAGPGADTVITGGGNDFVNPGDAEGHDGGDIDSVSTDGGNDTILGEEADVIDTGTGNDKIIILGPPGNGQIDGGPGNDQLDMSAATSALRLSADGIANDGHASAGTWNIGSAIENLIGGAGDDSIVGGPGNDLLIGNVGRDTLRGNGGSDTLDGGAGNDLFAGDAGIDTVTYADRANPVWARIGYFTNGEAGENDVIALGVENLIGGTGNDTLIGGSGANQLVGGDGNDSLSGLDGQDVLYGSAGNDTIDGGAAGDSLSGDVGNDSLLGGLGADNLWGGSGQDYLSGGPAGDEIDFIDAVDGEEDILALDWAQGDQFVWDEELDDTVPA